MIRRKVITNIALFLTAMTGYASLAGATYTLPASRSVTWAGHVGVAGDIPNRTAISTTLSPSGGDDATAIRNALNACPSGGVVKLNAGTFKVGSTINVPSNKTLRGAGMGSTIIQGQSGFSGGYVIGTSLGSTGTAYNLSSAAKGSSTITTSSPHNWVVGSYLLIDQLNAGTSANPPVTNVGAGGTCTWCSRESGNRVVGQMAKVVAVPSSTSATLEIPLYATYQPGLSAQAVEVRSMVQNAGIESLTVNNTASSTASAVYYGGANNWMLKVEIIGSNMASFRANNTYRLTLRGCKIHEGVPATPINGSQYGPSRGYGIWFTMGASANLVENNNLYHLSAPILAEGNISGNVWSYNVIHDMYYTDNSYNREAYSMHGAYPFMNLFEGNYSTDMIIADNYWGSTGSNTFFRNRHHYSLNKSKAQFNVVLGSHSWYWNFVGNVLGSAGQETTYETSGCSSSGLKAIFNFGCSNSINGGTWDQGVASTVLRHGNWDSVHNGPVWNASDDKVLPASMYLTSKPAWWGSAPWPIIGPDLSPMYPNVESTWVAPWGTGTSTAPNAPATLAVR